MKNLIIFVFGSNEAGRHGAGAAKVAYDKHGAVMGKGVGMHGKSYAIPTKDRNIETLDLPAIQQYVDQFIAFATKNSALVFQVTQIGCGLAGFTKEQIAPMFAKAPSNCFFDTDWEELMPENTKFWGTYK